MPFIYALRNRTTDLVYYGSTTRPIQTRFTVHKAHYSHYLRGKFKYLTAYEVVKCPTAYIELCEEVSEEDKLVRERWWIENHKCINKYVPTQTQAEWYIKNREHCIAKASVYQMAHLPKIMERRHANARLRLPSLVPHTDAV